MKVFKISISGVWEARNLGPKHGWVYLWGKDPLQKHKLSTAYQTKTTNSSNSFFLATILATDFEGQFGKTVYKLTWQRKRCVFLYSWKGPMSCLRLYCLFYCTCLWSRQLDGCETIKGCGNNFWEKSNQKSI